ncbi:hypothetical protein F2Q70_00012326 [Brassica cretica]|uniref:Uncharacterized protein n=1 Tax=Brassica cretica TaxID=69181 RepID=A0A8S9LSD8_BRACR|nr:hypothetical protein F2Q70_00012326 [Brassica cretica]
MHGFVSYRHFGKVRSLRSDRAVYVLGRYVATKPCASSVAMWRPSHRYNKVEASAIRAVGEIPSSNNLRLQYLVESQLEITKTESCLNALSAKFALKKFSDLHCLSPSTPYILTPSDRAWLVRGPLAILELVRGRFGYVSVASNNRSSRILAIVWFRLKLGVFLKGDPAFGLYRVMLGGGVASLSFPRLTSTTDDLENIYTVYGVDRAVVLDLASEE